MVAANPHLLETYESLKSVPDDSKEQARGFPVGASLLLQDVLSALAALRLMP